MFNALGIGSWIAIDWSSEHDPVARNWKGLDLLVVFTAQRKTAISYDLPKADIYLNSNSKRVEEQ